LQKGRSFTGVVTLPGCKGLNGFAPYRGVPGFSLYSAELEFLFNAGSTFLAQTGTILIGSIIIFKFFDAFVNQAELAIKSPAEKAEHMVHQHIESL
jgi:hypothetical protein